LQEMRKSRVIGNFGKRYSVSPDSKIKKGASLLAPFSIELWDEMVL